MGIIKSLLGLNSKHSWNKWLSIGALAIAALFALSLMSMFSFGWVFTIIVFLIALLITRLIAGAIGAVFTSVHSGKRQVASLRESEASGSEETLALDRLRLKVQALSLAMVIVGVVLLVVNLMVIVRDGPYVLTLIVSGAALVGLAMLREPAKRKYSESFKEQVVRSGLEAVLDDMEYLPENKLDEGLIQDARIFHAYDRYTGNDWLSAGYHGRKFVQGDVFLEKEETETYFDDDGDMRTRTVWHTVFKGRLVVLNHDALCNDPVFVYDKRNQARKSGITETETAAFNERFFIDAQDAITALRIVTPQVQMGILEASDKLGYCMSLAFVNDKLYIAIYSGDMFEAKTGGDATLSEQRQRVTNDITAILGLIDSVYLKDGGAN